MFVSRSKSNVPVNFAICNSQHPVAFSAEVIERRSATLMRSIFERHHPAGNLIAIADVQYAFRRALCNQQSSSVGGILRRSHDNREPAPFEIEGNFVILRITVANCAIRL